MPKKISTIERILLFTFGASLVTIFGIVYYEIAIAKLSLVHKIAFSAIFTLILSGFLIRNYD